MAPISQGLEPPANPGRFSIRIPKPFLEQTGLSDEVELEVRADELVIRSAKKMRADWEAAFAKMAEAGDDSLLDSEVESQWDEDEWTW